MLAPAGYRLLKRLDASARAELHEAVDESDGSRILAKFYVDSRLSKAEARARREVGALRRLGSVHVPEVRDLDVSSGLPVLILAHVPGIPLNRLLTDGPLAWTRWIEFASSLAEAVQAIHAHGLLHRDLAPHNVLVDPESLRTWVLGFDVAVDARIGRRDARELSKAGVMYTAPECTDWMDRSADTRSDLYSLGATLYHALTGHPPFTGDDVVAVIHAHLARAPEPPIRACPGLPPALSAIVLELLAKEPDARYQTAARLVTDLRACQAQLDQTGGIDASFVPGTSESPARLRRSTALHGRSEESARLMAQVERAAAGTVANLIVSGKDGIGKSQLIETLRPRVAQHDGLFLAGGFERERDVPYAGWITVLEGLCTRLLVGDDAQLARWRDLLLANLGNVAGAMTELVPELSVVLGEVPAVAKLGPRETRERLALAIARLLRACAESMRPLAIVLDDLQWADSASLLLLESVLSSSDSPGLLMVLAYRTHDADERDTLGALLDRLQQREVDFEWIQLGPLDPEGALGMVAELLDCSPGPVRPLAELIARKTGNHPLLIRDYLWHLRAEGWLAAGADGHYTWDSDAIAAADIPDGAVLWTLAKLERLGAEDREVAPIAACLGHSFEADALIELTGRPAPTIEGALHALVDQGIIAPASDGFRFVHARIRDATQALLSDDERARIHWRIGQQLLGRLPPDPANEQVFEAVEQLNLGLSLVSEDSRLMVVRWTLEAGSRALACGAGATARRYLENAQTLLHESDWSTHQDMCVRLLLANAEAAYTCGEFDGALTCLDALEKRPLSLLQWARCAVQRITVFAVTREPEACAPYVLESLARLGVRWPRHPTHWRVLLGLWTLMLRVRLSRRAEIFEPATSPPPHVLATQMILGVAGGVMARVTVQFTVLAVCLLMRLNLRHGFVSRPGYTLLAFAIAIRVHSENVPWSRQVARLARQWNERVPDAIYTLRTEMQARTLLDPWWSSRREALSELPELYEALREVGDVEFAHYTRLLHAVYSGLGGEPVGEISRRFRNAIDETRRALHRFPEPERCFDSYAWLACTTSDTALEQGVIESDTWIAKNPGSGSAEPYIRTIWMMVLCVYGRFDLAYQQSTTLGDRLFFVVPYLHVADHCFYRGLAAASLLADAVARERRGLRRDVRRVTRKLRRWARTGPDFVHMVTFLEAEACVLRGATERACILYRRAAGEAAAQGFMNHSALAYERLGRLLARRRHQTESTRALRDARERYAAWGAVGKVERLERELETNHEV